MGISRKHFLRVLAAIAAMGLPPKRQAIAAEENDLIPFTPDVALDCASAFVKSNCDTSAIAENPIPVVDVYGHQTGYAVDIWDGGSPSGYVLLDVNCPQLIAAFCLTSGSEGLYTQKAKALKMRRSVNGLGEPCLLQLSPANLYIYDWNEGVGLGTFGDIVQPFTRMQTSPKIEWQDETLMIPMVNAYNGTYTITSENYIGDYWFATEQQVEANTGRYACAVSALYTIAGLTQVGSRFLIDTYSDWNSYNSIWGYTGTEYTGGTGPWGGRTGSTAMGDIGP